MLNDVTYDSDESSKKILPQKKRKEQSLLRSKRRRKVSRRVGYVLLLFFVPLAIFSYLTNPFVRFSIIVDPFKTISYVDGQFELTDNASVFVQEDAFFRNLAQLKSGWHIVGNRFVGGQKTQEATIDEIISEIHRVRFNPDEPYLISGDHFSVLYPRSLGIFYHSLLDPRTALNKADWKNRQQIYLKTTAYALQAYQQADRLSTTIVPVGPRAVALANYYAYPSDTLYSLLYALDVLQSEEFLRSTYPYQDITDSHEGSLETTSQSQELLLAHKESLRQHLERYSLQVYDLQSGLIKKDILLSSAKDIAKRRSAFYDNVVYWRTLQLAQKLGLIESNPDQLIQLKQNILSTYWLEKEGYFLEDLSQKGVENRYYSSDWLIVLMTGFLDPKDPVEREYFERSVEYIQRNAIDKPFGLQYHPDLRREQLYPLPGTVAPAYGSTAIWSNWGMEYIKLLTILAQVTGDPMYLEQAEEQLTAYAYNMKRYRGYPEVYNKDGDFFRQTFYKSVRRTGWVVSYEQAREMFDWTRENLREVTSETSTSE